MPMSDYPEALVRGAGRAMPAGAGGSDWVQLAEMLRQLMQQIAAEAREGRQETRTEQRQEQAEQQGRSAGGQMRGMSGVQQAAVVRSPYPVQTAGGMARINQRRTLAGMSGIQDPDATFFPPQREGETDDEYEQRMLKHQAALQERKSAKAAANRLRTRRAKLAKAASGKPGRGFVVNRSGPDRFDASSYVEGQGRTKGPSTSTAQAARQWAEQDIDKRVQAEPGMQNLSRRLALLIGSLGL